VVDLVPEQFPEFFYAVHKHEPFEWQKRLAKEVLQSNRWPDVIRIPTGCGKTSVLDLAIFELALHGNRRVEERDAARRICFVVDRRLVVDEVTDHARRICRAIGAAAAGAKVLAVVEGVTGGLRRLAGEAKEPLRLVRLRGGVYRDDGWAADPLTPTILISTVDQIGSRLLFRGYGVSTRSLPVHAGLLAFDTRVILDEAHLSTVFGDILDCVRHYQQLAESPPLPESRLLTVVRMSATAKARGNSFELSDNERKDQRLRPRLEARKPAELVEVKVEPITKRLQQQRARAREQERRNREVFVKNIVEQARSHSAKVEECVIGRAPRVVGVVVNRVGTAREVFEHLREPSSQAGNDNAMLLTGRIRPLVRDRLLKKWLPVIRAGREREPEAPVFVVATQTVEVGANLDFDALVTEAASLDALRQRFGRVDRVGKRQEREADSPASIVIRSDRTRNSDDDPIYGPAIAETWALLRTLPSGCAIRRQKTRGSVVDFGINSLDANLPKDPSVIERLLARVTETPVLFPAHLDAWVQTNPRPEPDPDVAPFLHGRPDTPADVQVVWRADLDPDRRFSWAEIVSLMPPRTREALPVPIYEVQAWLRREAEAKVADVEGAEIETADFSGRNTGVRRVLRWRGNDRAEVVDPDALRPGDTVVVPAKYGGADSFGWNPRSPAAVEDVADQCLAQLVASYPAGAFRRPRLKLRLHPDLLPPADDASRLGHRALLRAAINVAGAEGQDAWPAIERLLNAIEPFSIDAEVKAVISALLQHHGRVDLYPGEEGMVISTSAPLELQATLPEDETQHDEPEGDEASFTGRQVLLTDHLKSVGGKALVFATNSGLEGSIAKAVATAGFWHDEGKRDPRFQAWLRGSEIKALAAEAPIAKSGLPVRQWTPSALFGYPQGARHEFLSVHLFELTGDEQSGGRFHHDLIKFLVGTHHGFGRPFVPILNDATPVMVELVQNERILEASSDYHFYRLDSGWTDLFWRMVRGFGWWGLAYLEALLVTADRTVSAAGG
jgi:CRISPR-associated endonuclease/helicase Cas3